MPCNCDLLPTVERLHGAVTSELRLRLQLAQAAGKDDVAFEDHMRLEEKYIIPHIKDAKVRMEFLQTHKEFRSYRVNKLTIPDDKFLKHANREREEFMKLGYKRG